ncbi:hypothetical protein AB0D12_39550 [Streptomyces sp. NPDC048479]|uniref:hypothetical protein n=1 Tax=Streptomyces sp. NPDC048479 TaxID=3154725 RepID=UPI00344246BB
MRNHGKPEGDRAASREAVGLLVLAAQKGEGEIESVDLTPSVLGDSALAAGEEALLQLVQAGSIFGLMLSIDSGCRLL